MAEVTSMPPAINARDRGARIVLVGTIMLCATALMVTIAGYNRYHARTLFFSDVPLLVLGAALNVVFFALSMVMVNNGLGRYRDELTEAEAEWLRKLFLGNLLVFFAAHCVVKIAYNLLARRTARSLAYKRSIDVFSGSIVAWSISNIVVVAYYLGTAREPNSHFILVSGSISIAIVLGQLIAFLYIIWGTTAKLGQKLSWSLCMTVFVPFCVAVIIVRLVYTPDVLFTDNWTFDLTIVMMLFLLDLNVVTITVLAPNLPLFFVRASTGGLYFMPTTRTDSACSYTMARSDTDRAYNSSTQQTMIESGVAQDRSKSEASDVILLQRSFEVTNEARKSSK